MIAQFHVPTLGQKLHVVSCYVWSDVVHNEWTMVLLRGQLGSRHVVYPNSSYCVVTVSQLQDMGLLRNLAIPEIDLLDENSCVLQTDLNSEFIVYAIGWSLHI